MYTDRNEIRQLRHDPYRVVIPQTQFRTSIRMSDHLIRKGAIYYYRRRVPADLLVAYGKAEYVRSLRTPVKRDAEVLCRQIDVEVDALFMMLRKPPEAPALFVDPSTGKTWDPNYRSPPETPAQKRVREEYEQDEQEYRDSRNIEQEDAEQEAWAAKQARKAKKKEQHLDDLAEVFRRAFGNMPQHSPATPPVSSHPTQPAAKSPKATTVPGGRTLTPTNCKHLHAILRIWAKEKEPVARTVQTAERAINRFRDLMGDIPVPAITKLNIVEFKDKLVAAALVAAGHTANTTNKTLNYMSIMFNHAIGQAWMDTDPAKGVRIAVKKKPKGSSRAPFSEVALNGIFAHPIYSEGVRPELGAGEAAYWLPLLGLYTGARIEELCQLSPKDIKQEKYRDSKGREQTAWVMHITGMGEGQGVKNTGSDRRIPVHLELQRLGFIKYAQVQKGKRIFPLLRVDKAGYEAPRWSVWWHKEMRKAGAFAGRNMVFHSFRHNFKDVCRDCGITKELADALQGHTEGDSSGGYGAALYPLNPMMDAMNKYKVHGVKLPCE
jgi:integrase